MEFRVLDERTQRYNIFMDWLRGLRYDDEALPTTLVTIATRFIELREIYENDFQSKHMEWYKKGKEAAKELAYVGFREEK